MTRHLVAVCVVCLICAKHLPCKQHFDNIITDLDNHQVLTLNGTTTIENKHSTNNDQKILPNQIPGQDSDLYHAVPLTLPNKRRGRTKNLDMPSTEHPLQNELETNYLRAKRHAHHGVIEKKSPNNSNEYVKRIFRQFGDEETLTMNFTGFEKMLKQLGVLLNEPPHQTHNNQQQENNSSTNNHDKSLTNDTVSVDFRQN